MLQLALIAERFKVRPSELAGVKDEIGALDFDWTCNIRLQIHDIGRKRDEARMMSLAHLAASAGEVLKFEDSEEDDWEDKIETLPSLTGNKEEDLKKLEDFRRRHQDLEVW